MRGRKKGFTLIELIIVMVIIAILIVIGLTYYSNSQKDARDAKRVSDLRSLQLAIEDYSTTNGSFPGSGKCANNMGVGWNYSSCQNGDWDRATDDISQILVNSAFIAALPLDPVNSGTFPGYSYGYRAWPTGSTAAYYLCTNLEKHTGIIQFGGYNYCLKGGCTSCH